MGFFTELSHSYPAGLLPPVAEEITRWNYPSGNEASLIDIG